MRVRASLPAVLCALALAACGDNATEPTLSPSTKPDFLPSHDALRAALQAVLEGQNGGLGFEMWASFVDRDGVVRPWCSAAPTAATSGPAAGSSRPRRPTPPMPSASRDSRSAPPTCSRRCSRAAASSGCRRAIRWIPGVAYGGKPQDYGTSKDPDGRASGSAGSTSSAAGSRSIPPTASWSARSA